jgi:hypothetical protein
LTPILAVFRLGFIDRNDVFAALPQHKALEKISKRGYRIPEVWRFFAAMGSFHGRHRHA